MNVFILDDDVLQAKDVFERAKNYFGESAEISVYNSGAELKTAALNGQKPDIAVLDIELSENESGIDVGKCLNIFAPKCKIIYLTGHIEYCTSVYESEHEYFVLKTLIDEKLPLAFARASETVDKGKKIICLESKSGKTLLEADGIIYVERVRRKSIITCFDGTYETPEPLEDILVKIKADGFVRCHNSYVVNLKNVRQYRSSEFIMKNGESVIVSRSYKKNVDKDFFDYIKERT